MNKFDALKMFQSWPPEWQRLCAECWIETGEDRPAVKLPRCDDPIPRPAYQPKAAAKLAAKPARNQMRYTRDELIEVDSHYSEGRGPAEVARIMDKKYPRQRTIDAWEKMANRIRKVGLQAMLDRAIDVEFK